MSEEASARGDESALSVLTAGLGVTQTGGLLDQGKHSPREGRRDHRRTHCRCLTRARIRLSR
jgi:hypothetical protein